MNSWNRLGLPIFTVQATVTLHKMHLNTILRERMLDASKFKAIFRVLVFEYNLN